MSMQMLGAVEAWSVIVVVVIVVVVNCLKKVITHSDGLRSKRIVLEDPEFVIIWR